MVSYDFANPTPAMANVLCCESPRRILKSRQVGITGHSEEPNLGCGMPEGMI